MSRKKKKKDDASSGVLPENIKRDIIAVFLFLIAVVFVLGFLGKAGLAGIYINKIIGLGFGWAKWFFPIGLLSASGVLLINKQEEWFAPLRIVGSGLLLISIVGLMHIFFETGSYQQIAEAGSGGGYFGYLISQALATGTGKIAGVLILVLILIIGLIFTFNFSIIDLIKDYIASRKEREEEYKDETTGVEEDNLKEDGDMEDEEFDEEALADDEDFSEESDDEESNIKNISFDDDLPLGDKEDADEDDTEGDKRKTNVKPVQLNLKRKRRRVSEYEWEMPPFELLEKTTEKGKGGNIKRNADIIGQTLGHFGIHVELGDIKTGPTVTQYAFKPAVGVKLSRITALSNDLALALAAHPIRIEAPIPGKSMVGIEVPNRSKAIVRLRDLVMSNQFQKRKSNLLVSLGEDVSGNYIFGDLKKMPHLLIAGSTGSGKSVGMNTILLSLLYQNSPRDLGLIMVDPKRVELSLYNGIPHLLSDVIVDNKKVISALKWAVSEMEKRYRLLQDTGSRDLESYNKKADEGYVREYEDSDTGEMLEEELERMPYIVICIDELADLMVSHGKEVEGAIIRLAQMARAVGMHLIVSTQRPSVEVITGLIKANITTRIAFKVATQIDSRTILDTGGAEKLLGNGDMLYSSADSPKPKRIQGVYVSEEEVKEVVDFIKGQDVEQNESDLEDALPGDQTTLDFAETDDDLDDLYEEAKALVIEQRKASTSFLQRRLRVGYARAARLIDELEDHGVVGPPDGAKARQVFIGGDEE